MQERTYHIQAQTTSVLFYTFATQWATFGKDQGDKSGTTQSKINQSFPSGLFQLSYSQESHGLVQTNTNWQFHRPDI